MEQQDTVREHYLLYLKSVYRSRVADPIVRQQLRERKREQYWEKRGMEAPPIIKVGVGRKRKIIPDDLDDVELFNVDTGRELEFI